MKVQLTRREAERLIAMPAHACEQPELRRLVKRWQKRLQWDCSIMVTEQDLATALRLILKYGQDQAGG